MTINDNGGSDAYLSQYAFTNLQQDKKPYRQEPIAVIGFANRLPGHSDSPTKLWDLLMRGGVAGNEPPASRWSLKGHFDGSRKPHTVRTPGAMFVENVDTADFDAGFFNISTADAVSIDPQQRQLLEVVYEGIENAGLSLEKLYGAEYGCFVGSYAVDYQDIQMRDPEDRADGMTIGVGRAILSNRISHFLNIKGASAIIAASNLYLCPEQNQDMGAMRAASSFSGKCHTFDAKADGYCKAEGINTVILKRLSDAIRDGDPIRAVIRGTATNSDGWTPGIASPNAKAQTEAMRAAFSAAGITNLNEVGYLEAHGTGTLAGDPIELAAASSVFAPSRSAQNPLIVGSIKSNIGHSENAAGISGLIKAIMAVETGIIPGNPTFIDPNPKIDFVGLKVKATRTAIPWPSNLASRATIDQLQQDGHFARLLQVNLAYHSKYMSNIGDRYLALLEENCGASLSGCDDIQMFSSVTDCKMTLEADAIYWKTNMVSPVLFDAACTAMISGKDAADFLIELGPSGALAGPVAQINKGLGGPGRNVQYVAAAKRGPDSVLSMYDVAGRLYIAGHDIAIEKVNRADNQEENSPVTLVDLPNYAWNHSTKYWYESDASKEWRYRHFVHHDLLGSKILNSPWHAPTFRKMLDVKDVPWLTDQKMGSEIVFPGAAFCAMAIEAMFQCKQMTEPVEGISSADQYQYRLRRVKFDKALVLVEGQPAKLTLTLIFILRS
ncbi:hypothetical protein ARSEF4850_007696 [Beauveria asiatica]